MTGPITVILFEDPEDKVCIVIVCTLNKYKESITIFNMFILFQFNMKHVIVNSTFNTFLSMFILKQFNKTHQY